MGGVLIWLAQAVVKFVLETFKPEIQKALRRILRR
jgi:hypothetical protein